MALLLEGVDLVIVSPFGSVKMTVEKLSPPRLEKVYSREDCYLFHFANSAGAYLPWALREFEW